MVDVAATSDRIEERSDLGTGDVALWRYWNLQEAIAEREERRWKKRAREIIRRYRDERPDNWQEVHRFNILWSNVQTLLPTLYGRTPKADVSRRYKDADPIGRLASTILERALDYTVEAGGFDCAMRAVVEDRLLPGRGVARVLYVPHFGEPIREETNAEYEEAEDAPTVVDSQGDENRAGGIHADPQDEGTDLQARQPQTQTDELREVLYEEVRFKYVFWEDYREGPARQWDEVPWVRYRSYMTRDELTARFGKEKAALVNLDYVPKGGSDLTKDDIPPDAYKKAVVFETWDKTKKQVVWWAPGTPDVILDKQDDPLRLPDFFPNPDPLLATTTNDKRIPVPDYIEYQDQARALDRLTERIERLERAMKVAGVYPASEKQSLQQLVDEGTENRLIPVEDWAVFAEKVGPTGFIVWLPIQQIAEVLIRLYDARDRNKQILYEITGIADIIRGASNPTETATAQQIKSNFASLRISPQQQDVAKFARSLLRLAASVIAEHFSAKTLSMMTNYPQLQPVPQLPAPPPQVVVNPQTGQPAPNPAFAQWQQMAQQVRGIQQQNDALQKQFDAAVELLRQDAAHDFRIDIEADSTIAGDEQAEKQARVEFLQQMVPLLEQVVPFAQGNPAMAALAREITLFAVRGFKAGRPLEETFEKAFDAIAQMPPNPKVTGQGQGGKGGNVDSPADLAVRSKEIDSKTLVQQQANAIKAQQVEGQLQIEAAKAADEAQLRRAELVMDAAKLQDQQAYRQRRVEVMDERATGHLV